MYNRYIRNDNGSYTRITEDDGTSSRRPPTLPPPTLPDTPPKLSPTLPDAPPKPSPPSPDAPQNFSPPLPGPPPPLLETPPPPPNPHGPPSKPFPPRRRPPLQDGLNRFLRHFLNLSHMENVDAGDTLILLLLFLLYREGADEETLVALGLLLIL